MAQSVIGALRVTLGADTAQFEKSMSRAQSRMARVGAGLKTAATAAAVAVGVAATAMSVAMSKVIDGADELSKTASKIGVPTAELSRLGHAADLSGVSLGSLSNAFGRLSANMFDLSKGVGEAAARAFDQIGVSVTKADGSLKSSQAVMLEVADRFAGMKDGAEKTAIAMAIFGKSGRDLIPMLNAGSAGIAEMKQEADELGIVIGGNTGRAAELFNDNMSRLGARFRGLVTEVTSRMLPSLVAMSEHILDVMKRSDNFQTTIDSLVSFMRGLIVVGMEVAFVFERIGAGISALGEAASLVAGGEFTAAFDRIRSQIAEDTRLWDELRVKQDQVWRGLLSPQARIVGAFDALTIKSSETNESMSRLGNTISKKVSDPLNLLPANFSRVGQAVDKAGEGFKEVGRVMESAFTSAFDGLIDGTFNARDALTGLLKDFNRLLLNKVFQQFAGALFGGSSGGGFFANLFGGGNAAGLSGLYASGGVFGRAGATPFAKGGVVNGATVFPFANGVGLMGEAGPEAVMPLRRDGAGNLGVLAGGGGSSPMEINVRFFDTDGKEVEGQKSKTSGGFDFSVAIDRLVGDAITRRGSRTRSALESSFGLSQPLAGR